MKCCNSEAERYRVLYHLITRVAGLLVLSLVEVLAGLREGLGPKLAIGGNLDGDFTGLVGETLLPPMPPAEEVKVPTAGPFVPARPLSLGVEVRR